MRQGSRISAPGVRVKCVRGQGEVQRGQGEVLPLNVWKGLCLQSAQQACILID